MGKIRPGTMSRTAACHPSKTSFIAMHIGLADFNEPTLLLLGDPVSLNWLADRIEAQQVVDFMAFRFVKLVNVRLVILPADDGGSLREGLNKSTKQPAEALT